jgi:hypothetical protein
METPLKPDFTIEWRGHPDGFPRNVRVFFAPDAKPGNAREAGADLAERLNTSTTEGLFNNAVFAFAEAHGLSTMGIYHKPSHQFPFGDTVTVSFKKETPLATTIIG